jgi:acetylornithine/N-succinyldiaminopimelate aminotransferase
MSSTRQLFFEILAQTSPAPIAIEIEKALGCWLYSSDGRKYLDLIAGVSVSNIGHNNPAVINAVKEQLDRHMHLMVYGEFIQKPQVRLADKLCSLLPRQLNTIYFTSSGSEAVEGAIKLARRHTGRYGIISFRNAYHGSTMGALSVTGNETLKRAFRPLLPAVRQVDFNSEESLDEISGETACVLVEPIQAEAGVIMPENNFLGKLRARCSEKGALLVFDEIQTGFGRTGKLFAMDWFGVCPDIILFAKSFGGGLPLGAFVSSGEIMSSLRSNPALGHITTFGGHPVSCSAGLASLEYIIANKLAEKARVTGEKFHNLLVHPAIRDIRGKGLLIAMELEDASTVKKVVNRCLSEGLITEWFLFNDTSIRISPPLIISDSETEEASEIIIESLNAI